MIRTASRRKKVTGYRNLLRMDAWLAVKWRRLLSARSTHPRGGIINSRLGPLSLSNPFTFTHDDASTRLFLSRRTEPNRDETRREASFFYSFSGKRQRGTRSRRPLTELITLRINTFRQCAPPFPFARAFGERDVQILFYLYLRTCES